MTLKPSFLGRGFAYPFRLDAQGIAPAFVDDEQSVREGMVAIIGCDVRERPFRVRNGIPYGTRVRALLFSNSESDLDIARFDTEQALTVWEPRIFVLEVDAAFVRDPISGARGVDMKVRFRYRATNRIDNFVLPFRTEPVEENAT